MVQMICPMCSETVEEDGSHFLKHFKYKRYECGDDTCHLSFYTEAERNSHCTKDGHKRSFQKTVNPYVEKMIQQLVEDARELATKDMGTVIENRWGNRQKPEKRRKAATATETPVSTKKTKNANSPFAFLNNLPSTSSSPSSQAPPPPGPSSSSGPSSSGQPRGIPIVDSTTEESTTATTTTPSEKTSRKSTTTRKRGNSGAAPNRRNSERPVADPVEDMSAIDKIVGWFDPNVPEMRDAAKVTCDVCKQEIVYDFILRKGHVTRDHMAADVAQEDYDEILKEAMNRSFPDLPNSDFACQLCMTGTEIRKNLRREHIEKNHTTSLLPLECPVEGCDRGFRRQCDLSSHMKEIHKVQMCNHRDPQFQQIRRRRNAMINEMINKCFPWSRLEAFESKNLGEKSDSILQIQPIDLNKDVRVRDCLKTRRAPQYNASNGSSSSSSSSDSEPESENAEASAIPAQEYPEDVIFISEHFNSEISQKLSQRSVPMIKAERMDSDHEMETSEVAPIQQEEEKEAEDVPLKNEDVEEQKVEEHVENPEFRFAVPTPSAPPTPTRRSQTPNSESQPHFTPISPTPRSSSSTRDNRRESRHSSPRYNRQRSPSRGHSSRGYSSNYSQNYSNYRNHSNNPRGDSHHHYRPYSSSSSSNQPRYRENYSSRPNYSNRNNRY